MGNKNTQILKQAFDVYTTLSDMSVKDAVAQLHNMKDLSDEVKQVVITLFSSQDQASQYVQKKLTPTEEDFLLNTVNYHEGSQLGEYKLLEKIGHGGMSVVFKAKRIGGQAQKYVAIKIFSPKSFAPQLLEHFINEQKILANLSHPNIVNMLHGDKSQDGNVYLVMELIDDALPITKYCQQHKLSTNQKVKLIAQCAKTLAYSHANLIIHRDLKPDNILLNSKEHIKIVDFGIAKLISNDVSGNKTTIMALTPSYAAPEQINAEPISVKTDIFSLAVVALELLTGTQVLPNTRLLKSCAEDEQTIDAALKNLTIDKDLKNILQQGMAQNPDERYSSMQGFADDLSNYLSNKPVNATVHSSFYRLRKFAKRNTGLFVMSLAFIGSLILGLTYSLWQNQQTKIASTKAQSVKQFLLDSYEVTNPNNAQGINISAKDILKNAVAKIKDNKNLDKEVKFELFQSLGIAYYQLGYVDDAINLLKKSLALQANNSKSLTTLAQSYLLAEKHEALEKLLATTDESQFQSKADAIQLSLVRARYLSLNAQYDKAIALIEKIKKKDILQDSPTLFANVQLVLAKIYYEKSDNNAAITLLKNLIAASQLPKNHTLIMDAKLELGRNYNIIDEHDLALEQFEPLEKTFKQILGENHPDLGRMYNSMSSSYKVKGNIQKAKEYAQLSYEHNAKTFNNKGNAVAESLDSLSVLALMIDDDLEKAMDYNQKAIAVLEQTYSEDYPQLLEIKTNYAYLLRKNKQYDEALALISSIYAVQKEKLGINHNATINTESTLIGALIDLKQIEKAKEMAANHLQRAKKHLTSKNMRLANAYLLMAKVYLLTKEYQKRLAVLLEFIDKKLLDESDPSYAIFMYYVANAYHDVGDNKMAINYFQKAIEKSSKIFSANHIATTKIKLHYALLLKSINRTNELEQLLHEIKTTVAEENYTDKFVLNTLKKLEQ